MYLPLRDRSKQHTKSSGDHFLTMLQRAPMTLVIGSAWIVYFSGFEKPIEPVGGASLSDTLNNVPKSLERYNGGFTLAHEV